MQVEHKLTPTVAGFAKQTVQELERLRREQLMALGQAKEIEWQIAAARATLSQQLSIFAEDTGLPRPIAPYHLSADGSALVGEIADTPAIGAAVNGSQHG